ncbi:MAG TPA: hypothetical protein VFJ74_05740 [Gemmatimonadaceae bacterium]|nr:hypothetical protein [Gemmatimonadaceae bacterium]
MRTMRSAATRLGGAGLLALLLAGSAAAQQQQLLQQTDPYPATTLFGTGLVTIPVAWVSPRTTDAWLTTSGLYLPSGPDYAVKQGFASLWNTNISTEVHLLGRVAIGAAAYDQNADFGFFGQVLLLKQNQLGGAPALAVGVRNIGNCKTEDRVFIGCDVVLGPNGYERITEPRYKDFKTLPTLYGVVTKDFAVGGMGQLPASVGLTLGYGNGLFSEDGGLGKQYNQKGTIAKGLFLGARYVAHPTLNTLLTVMAENDGWDYNAGVVADWRGIALGLYATGIEEGSRGPYSKGFYVYNYLKPSVSLGYNGNILDIAHGVLLRSRITELTREQLRLQAEIAARERRIRGLEVALRKAQAGELAEIARRRQQLETELQQERDAIRRATERLRDLQSGKTPPTPPPATPPQNPPSSKPPSASPSQTPPATTPSTTPAGGTRSSGVAGGVAPATSGSAATSPAP